MFADKRAAVGPGFVRLDAFLRGDERRVLHHDDVVRISAVVGHAQHEARHAIERIVWLGAEVRPVGRVGVDVDVVAVVDVKIASRLGIHVQLMFADAGGALIQAVGIAEVRVHQHVPIDVRPAAMHPVARLRRQAVELEAFFPEKVFASA